MTYIYSDVIFCLGGDYIYELLIFVFSIVLSFNIVTLIIVKKREKYVANNDQKLKLYNKNNVLSKYFNNIEKKLFDLGNPYGLNVKKYIFIKYFLSIFLFLYIIFKYNNLLSALFVLFLFILLPNILIRLYKKEENTKIISEISNIVQSLILSLSAGLSLYNALKISINSIKYPRLKKEYTKFVDNYMLYNFNINKSTQEFSSKFDSYEFNMFLSILIQSQNQNSIIEILENFNSNLELSYFKYLKLNATKKMLMIVLSTIIILVNTILIVMYPMVSQIGENLNVIFS